MGRRSGLWMRGTSSAPPSWKRIVPSNGKTARMVFSGDLGRYDALILRDPTPVEYADYLLVESTYGNRRHAPDESVDTLASIINETAKRGGMLVIPSFAVGRTQTLLYLLRDMRLRGVIPDLPIFVDSPMAQRVTDVFCRHIEIFDEEARAGIPENRQVPDSVAEPAVRSFAGGIAENKRYAIPRNHSVRKRYGNGRSNPPPSEIPAAGSAEYGSFCGLSIGRDPRPDAARRRAGNQDPRRNGAGAGADPKYRSLFGTCGFHGDHALAAPVQTAAQNDLCRPRRGGIQESAGERNPPLSRLENPYSGISGNL